MPDASSAELQSPLLKRRPGAWDRFWFNLFQRASQIGRRGSQRSVGNIAALGDAATEIAPEATARFLGVRCRARRQTVGRWGKWLADPAVATIAVAVSEPMPSTWHQTFDRAASLAAISPGTARRPAGRSCRVSISCSTVCNAVRKWPGKWSRCRVGLIALFAPGRSGPN